MNLVNFEGAASVTTFDFSIHEAPPGEDWQERFSNDGLDPAPLVDSLGPFGVDGWGGHSAFVEWADHEKLPRHTPDWCLHVAKCSRAQLLNFAGLCLQRQLCDEVAHAAFMKRIQSLSGSDFVIRVLEF